jgi:NH3-dependent NAD+ synthetase
LNRHGEVIPQAVIDKAPTAELKSNQRDEDDLPPYAVLDAIIERYVERYESPLVIAERLGLSPEMVRAIMRRIDQSEYKRQQAAPGLKVSRKAFGMGRRLPIAQRYEPEPAPVAADTGDTVPLLEASSRP